MPSSLISLFAIVAAHIRADSRLVVKCAILHTAYSTSPPVAQEKLGLFIFARPTSFWTGLYAAQHTIETQSEIAVYTLRLRLGFIMHRHGDWCRNRADASTNWLEGNLGIYYRSDHCLSCHLGSTGHLFKNPF